MLYREQTFAPRAFHSELQQQTNTQKIPALSRRKGGAEAWAERFSALKFQHPNFLRPGPKVSLLRFGSRGPSEVNWLRGTGKTPYRDYRD